MKFVVIDAETYWTPEYSLSKMTSESYIRDPQFKVQGWGVMPIGKEPAWLTEEEFKRKAANTDWSDTAIICHNTRFDGAILGWHYGIKPRLWVDTMGIYRALYPHLRSYALGALGKHFQFGEKGNADWTRGIRDLSLWQWSQLGDYCKDDCRITGRLFEAAWGGFTPFERMVMDMTLRMFIEPVLMVDEPVLWAFHKDIVAKKEHALKTCNIDRDQVMSNDKFAALLQGFGVEPPMKPSPSNPDREIYAFAKTDEAMDELADHDDIRVQALVAARLGNKSTLLETRTRHVIEIGRRGALPIPLNYWGAKVTGRHSGGDKLNMQNFTRGSVLRDGLLAPPGHKVVVGDSSNIELRLVMALAGQWDAIEKIRSGMDLYCDFATDIYGKTITKADVDERFVGKQGMLSLQYMASDTKFGNMMRQKKHPLVPAESTRVKDVYRRKHRKVVDLWYYCENEVIQSIATKSVMRPVDVNGWFLTNTTGFALPGDIGVQYPDLRRMSVKKQVRGAPAGSQTFQEEWSYDSGRGRRTLYGAKVVENLCQHAARQVVMYQALLVQTRYRVIHSVHDELVCCVPENEAEECAAFMLQCLSTAPKWAQGRLPVTGEVGIGDSYGEAK